MLRVIPGAILTGLLLVFSGSPWSYWILAVTGLILFYRGLAKKPWRVRFVRGWVTGFTLFVITLAWQRQFTVPGWLLLSAFEALFFALAALLVPARHWRAPAFVAAMYLAESLRIRLPWGGLPMGGITTGQANGPLAEAASIVGEPGLVALLAWAAVGLSELRRINPLKWLAGWTSIALVASFALLGAQVSPSQTGTLNVAAVQGGGPQAVLAINASTQRVFDAHYEATDQVKRPVDVILWPENTITVRGPIEGSVESRRIAALAEQYDAYVVSGVVEPAGPGRFRNAVVAWGPDGAIVDRYEKVQRVPFGEFIPGRQYLDKIVDLSAVPKDAVIGTGPAVLQLGETAAGVGVSFEGLFSRRAREAALEGGEVLFIPTNASSYESDKVAKSQVQAARFRAIETGRWIVQASPTGISAIIDNDGEVQSTTDIGPAAVLQQEVGLSSSITPYVRWGDTPWLIITALLLALSWQVSTKRTAAETAKTPSKST